MSQPTPFLKGKVYVRERCTRDGLFYFASHAAIVDAFMFIVATAARRFNIGIVSYALMDTHLHLVIVDLDTETDGPSNIPRFNTFVFARFSQFLNAYWGEECSGAVVCPDSTGNNTLILDLESVIEKTLYVLANPVTSGVVSRPEILQGAVSKIEWLLEPINVKRPSSWFREQSWEDSEELGLVVPPDAKSAGYDAKTYYDMLQKKHEGSLRRIRRERKKRGLRFGTYADQQRKHYTQTNSKGRSAADHSEAPIMGKDPETRARGFHHLRAFRRWHRRAVERKKAGHSDVTFPPGTYKAMAHYGVRVAPMKSYEASVRRRDEGRLCEIYGRWIE